MVDHAQGRAGLRSVRPATVTAEADTASQHAALPDQPRRWQREFDEWTLVHRKRPNRMALWFCRNRADAEDLVQETFRRAFRHFEQVTPGTHSLTWLAAVLHEPR
jgi:RNA polymerase sigma-70 factor, ECF subfamily